MDKLNEAVILYVGWGTRTFPKEDANPVLDRFGPDEGRQLVEEVSALLEELNAIQPDWSKHDLASAADWAADQLVARHPELIDSKKALAWIFSWWNK